MIKTSDILIRAKGLLNAHPKAWIKWSMYGPKTPEGPTFCAMGACRQAAAELGYGGGYPQASSILNKAAVVAAEELGKPLRTLYNDSARGDRVGRVADAAYFNNTSDSLDEINKMFCKAIDMAIEKEES